MCIVETFFEKQAGILCHGYHEFTICIHATLLQKNGLGETPLCGLPIFPLTREKTRGLYQVSPFYERNDLSIA
jgi:hypothetical protein